MKHIVLQILLDFPCTPYAHVESLKRRDEVLQHINTASHLQILPPIDQLGGDWGDTHL